MSVGLCLFYCIKGLIFEISHKPYLTFPLIVSKSSLKNENNKYQ